MPDTSIDAILGRVPSGIYVLTCRSGSRSTGMLASWVMQAGFAPPMVSVAIKQDRYVAQWLAQGDPFALNLLGERNTELMRHFGKGFALDDPAAFAGIETTAGPDGVPIPAGTVGYLVCKVVGHVDSGDHRLFLAQVTAGQLERDTQPLLHVRKSGAHY